MKILFVTHTAKNCGVYQYGLRVFNAIKELPGYLFDYVECANIDNFQQTVEHSQYSAILYNYHPTTLPFIDPASLKKEDSALHIAVMHEMSQEMADQMTGSGFHYYIYGDPTLVENNPRVFKIGRIIPKFENTSPPPKKITVGSYGFAGKLKGFEQLVEMVQNEFDDAIIRLNIPYNGVVDKEGAAAQKLVKECQKKIRKKGIQLEVTHEFFEEKQLIEFLASNTINVFPYIDKKNQYHGIASAPDHALAAGRPLAISEHPMFRHLLSVNPSIVISKSKPSLFSRLFFKERSSKGARSLKEIIADDFNALEKLKQDWSEENFKKDFKRILERIFSREKEQKWNRLLDNEARQHYEYAIQHLFRLAPETITRKIPRANVQQAFVFNAVCHFASLKHKILCIGSYEDTACEALQKLGYQIETIDPEINHDLDTFFHLPTTKKESYDIVFSTSVLEHVESDELFLSQMAKLLAPNGVGILTCDYKNDYQRGDYIFPGNFRFYTHRDLLDRVVPLLEDCQLVGSQEWEKGDHDFEYGNVKYAFASLVFQKSKTPSI